MAFQTAKRRRFSGDFMTLDAVCRTAQALVRSRERSRRYLRIRHPGEAKSASDEQPPDQRSGRAFHSFYPSAPANSRARKTSSGLPICAVINLAYRGPGCLASDGKCNGCGGSEVEHVSKDGIKAVRNRENEPSQSMGDGGKMPRRHSRIGRLGPA